MVGLIQGTGGGQRQRHVQGRLRRGRCATHGLPLHRGTTQVTGADGQERITKKIGRNIVYIFIWYILYMYIIIMLYMYCIGYLVLYEYACIGAQLGCI